LVADRAVQRVVEQQKLDDAFLQTLHRLRLGVYHRAVGYRKGTGRYGFALPFNFDQAHAAYARRVQLGMVAKDRKLDAGVLRRLDEEHPLRNLHLFSVYGDRHHLLTHAERAARATRPQALPATWASNS